MPSALKFGAAWDGQDRNGNPFISIVNDSPVAIILQPGQRILLFVNNEKQTDAQPDWSAVIPADRAADRERSYQAPLERDDYSPAPAPARRAAPAYAAPEDVPPPPRAAPSRSAAPAPARQPAGAASRRPPAPMPEDELDDPFAEDDIPPARSSGKGRHAGF